MCVFMCVLRAKMEKLRKPLMAVTMGVSDTHTHTYPPSFPAHTHTQAKLRKQLMAVTMGATEGTPEAGGDSAEDDEDEDRGRSSRGRGGGLRQGELVAVKQSLLSLAQETVCLPPAPIPLT